MSVSHTTAFAPASIGNVSLGFDLLGAALRPIDGTRLGDSVTVQTAEQLTLSVDGRFAHKLPSKHEDNIVLKCYQHFANSLKARGIDATPAALSLTKRLPIGSGLGSSASSIVAAFHALNQHYETPFSQAELLLMMGELEGQISGSVHYDNVAPSFLGGLTLMTNDPVQPVRQLPLINEWFWVVSYSGLSVSTSEARNILPTEYKMADVLSFGQQLAVFVDALHRQDAHAAAREIKDVIAEPWRKSLLPGFDEARAKTHALGGLAFGISGSGPTVFSVTNDLAKAKVICEYLQTHYVQNKDGFSHVCTIPKDGALIELTSVS